MNRFLRTCRRVMWRVLSATAIAAAILVGAAKLVLPYAANYRPQIEQRLADYLGQPVSVGELTAQWSASGPLFILRDVRLLNPSTGETELDFEQARLHYNIWAWARLNNRNPTTFTIVGTSVLVTRGEEGEISVEGIAAAGVNGGGGDTGFLPWLVDQGNIHLASWEVSYRDVTRPDVDITVAVQRLRLKNLGERHFLAGSVVVPGLPEHEFAFGAEWEGLPAEARGLSIYLRGERVPVSDLLNRIGVQPVATLSGEASFEVWTDWEDRGLRDITGNVSVFDVHLESNTIDAAFWADQISAFVNWKPLEEGWLLDLDDMEFGADGHVWPAGGLSIRSRPDGYDFGADYLKLDDVTAMLTVVDQLDPALRQRLQQWSPRGALRGFQASMYERESGPWVTASAQMDGVGIGPGEGIPGISGLSGQLDLTSDEGSLEIYGAQPSVSLNDLFPGDLDFAYATGRVSWVRTEEGWRVDIPELFAGNDDLDLHTRLRLLTRSEGRPFIDMFTTIRDLDVAAAKAYVPTGLLGHKQSLLDWLDTGPVSGRITSAAATLYGELEDFPFRGNEGRFEINANIEDAVVDYNPEWPRAEQVDAEVQFMGLTMQAELRDARVFNTELVNGTVRIGDLTRAYLTLDAAAFGPAPDGLRFLHESPLNSKYGEHIAALEASGDMRASIQLGVPLTEGTGDTNVDGHVDLLGNTITEKRWGFAVSDARGDLEFADEGITSEGVNVVFREHPSVLDIHIGTSLTENPENILEARLTGTMPVATLLEDYETLLPLASYTEGESPWLIRLAIPENPGADPNTMTVSSTMVGTAINFPEPLQKLAEDERPVEVVFAYPQGHRPIHLHYGEDFQGLFEMGDSGLSRGTLHFGTDEPQLLGEGMSVTGHVGFINAADWWTGFDGLFEEDDADASPLLRHIEVLADRVSLTGRFYDNVFFKADRVDEVWQAEMDADQVVGRMQLPARGARRNAIVMDLERLDYPEAIDESAETDMDPRELPELHLFARELTWAGCPLGEVRLETYATVDGLQVGLLESSSDTHTIRATGDWNVSGEQEYSDFDITFTSERLGASLDMCNFPGVLKGGQTVAQIDAWWAGSPADFELARLNGQLRISMGSGNMLDVEPGAGRMVGLFSVESLPRRLTLDFSDVLESGFGFDSIEGTFELRDGSAYTNDIVVEAPSGTVLVIGRTGLAERDYDQEVTVKPKISGTLPIVAGLALGPPGAAIAFVFQNILKSELSEMAVYRYSVTGSWDDPQIEALPLTEPEPTTEASDTTIGSVAAEEQGGL